MSAAEIRITEKVRDFDKLPTDCPITVWFTSYSSGIDGDEYDRVVSYVRDSRDIAEATAYPWGFEGEQTLCLRIDDPAAAGRIFEDLRSLLPKRPCRTTNGPTGCSFLDRRGLLHPGMRMATLRPV
jgi:hypothetical protein